MAIFIHEFLYRGRPEGAAEPPAWHLTLVSTGTNDFGETVRSEKTLTMAEAQAAGWDLPEIIAAINAETLIELDAKRAEVVALQAKLETAERKDAAA